MPRVPLALALGVGAGGSLVDVSTYARLETGLKLKRGRESQYEATAPGEISFVLDNADGRFTPGNTSSPLATQLVEGAEFCAQVGTRLTHGKVASVDPAFPGSNAAWSEVAVLCEDMLGICSRTQLESGWVASLIANASPIGYYPLDDDGEDGKNLAYDQSSRRRAAYRILGGTVTFGVPGFEHDQVQIDTAAGVTGQLLATGAGVNSLSSGRYQSMWVTPLSASGTFLMGRNTVDLGDLSFGMTGGRFVCGSTQGPTYQIGRTYFLQMDHTTGELFVDGVSYGPPFVRFPGGRFGDSLFFSYGGADPLSVRVSDIATTSAYVPGETLLTARGGGTAAGWVSLLESATAGVDFASLPTSFSQAQLLLEPGEDTVLDQLDLIVRGEQGFADCVTTGTLLSPSEQVVLRGRDRPLTPTVTLDAERELAEAPVFLRDVRNIVSRVRVSGPVQDAVVEDRSLQARAGNGTASEVAAFVAVADLRAFGEDRIVRGSNTRLGLESVVVDLMTTPTDISAAILGLRQGDMVRITNLPPTQLGFSSWDGWLVGVSEEHTLDTHRVELMLAPTIDIASFFNTARFAGGSALQLTAAITAAATSFQVSSVSSPLSLLSTTETPYTVKVDDEQMTVTAVTGTSSPQTVTVVRGANGTTAVTHAINARVELAQLSLLTY